MRAVAHLKMALSGGRLGGIARRVRARLGEPRVRRWLGLGVLALSLAFMAVLMARSWRELAAYRDTWRTHFPLLLLAFALCPAGLAPNAAGWHLLMARLGGPARFRENARVYCTTCLPKYLPGGLWHIAGRSVLNKDQGTPHRVTLLGATLEWILLVASGLLVYLSCGLLALGLGSGAALAGLSPGLAVGLLVPLLVLLLPPVFNRLAARLFAWLKRPPLPPLGAADLLRLFGVYGLAWLAGGGVLFVLAQAIVPLPAAALPAVLAAWGGAGAVGFIAAYIVQGLGIRDVTLALLLSSLAPMPAAIVIAILFRLVLTLAEVVWPLVWLRLMAGSGH